MAKPAPSRPTPGPRAPQPGAPEIVDARWLLRAGAAVLVVALLCGYATLCLLFYQGQWQMILHPVRTEARPATIAGRPFDLIRFGPDSSGLPQRSAWWMPAVEPGRFSHLVLLYLPAGDGSLVDATATLETLRALGCTVFAVNYRGFGASAPVHLSQATMQADAEAAWIYLVRERHVREDFLLPVGAGVGGALALTLASSHLQTPAVVLDTPRFDILATVEADPRVRLLPVRSLLHDRFSLAPELATSRLPKLLLLATDADLPHAQAAADPKLIAILPHRAPEELDRTLRRFLDLYTPPAPVSPLMPIPQPPR